MGWIGKLEHYFCLIGVQEGEKMKAIMVAMEGNALP